MTCPRDVKQRSFARILHARTLCDARIKAAFCAVRLDDLHATAAAFAVDFLEHVPHDLRSILTGMANRKDHVLAFKDKLFFGGDDRIGRLSVVAEDANAAASSRKRPQQVGSLDCVF